MPVGAGVLVLYNAACFSESAARDVVWLLGAQLGASGLYGGAVSSGCLCGKGLRWHYATATPAAAWQQHDMAPSWGSTTLCLAVGVEHSLRRHWCQAGEEGGGARQHGSVSCTEDGSLPWTVMCSFLPLERLGGSRNLVMRRLTVRQCKELTAGRLLLRVVAP